MRFGWKRWAALLVVFAVGLGMTAYAADDDPNAITNNIYKKGFKLQTADKNFGIRFFSAMQLRFTMMDFDPEVSGNKADYTNFYMRRARLWWDGYAFDPRFTFYFHLQLEPNSAVNTHDIWINYKFSDMLNLGAGRMKIAYGLEFLNSGFGLNFVERSVMYGETDIDKGGGYQSYPGGGTAGFGLNAENSNTGFPTGGMTLYRSQGIQLSGNNGKFEYQLGAWNGRRTRGTSNLDDNLLYVARVGFYPMGFINWLPCGDVNMTEKLKIGIIGSYYNESKTRNKLGDGSSTSLYEADDSGLNLAFMLRYRGFSADVEWSEETYDLGTVRTTGGSVIGDYEFDREGIRYAFGYMVVPKKVEIVARYAEIERLSGGTVEDAIISGLGLATIGGDSYLERKIYEHTVGVNWYLNQGHQHKFFIDYTQLTRELDLVYDETTKASHSSLDQEDDRFRAMLQFKF